MIRRRRKRARVWIIEAKETDDPLVPGGRLYAITPEDYDGPFKLEPGTVLELVSTPKEKR